MSEFELEQAVTFIDKTGERLKGRITEIGFNGDPDLVVVLCYKEKWDQTISCLVGKENLTLIEEYSVLDDIAELLRQKEEIMHKIFTIIEKEKENKRLKNE